MVYLGIKEMSGIAEDVIIVTSSLTKDMTGKVCTVIRFSQLMFSIVDSLEALSIVVHVSCRTINSKGQLFVHCARSLMYVQPSISINNCLSSVKYRTSYL